MSIMSDSNKDELIEAQKQVIGILFDNLDEEYFQIISIKKKTSKNEKRIQDILSARTENAKIVTQLLKQLEV